MKTDPGSTATWKRTLAVMFFAQMVAMIGFSSIFPFLPLYIQSLGTVSGLSVELCTGLVFSGQAFSMMIAAPIWGALADRWGRKLMVERALFGGAVILGLMALVRSAEELVLLRMIQGLVSGVLSATNALVAAAVPRERSGFAMGLMQVAMGLGLGLGPVIGGVVADAYGYRAAFYITAALLVMAGGVVFCGVEEQFAVREHSSSRVFNFTDAWRRVLAAPGVRLMYALRFINQMGRIIFIPILPLLVMTLIDNPGRVNSFTGIVIGAASAATALFSIYLGRMGDRSGHRRIVITCLFGAGLLFFLQGLVNAGWQLLVLQMLYGVALGGIVTGISALLAIHSESGDEGAVYGLDSSITSGARVIGPLLGVGIAAWMGVRTVFLTAGLLYLLAALLAFLSLPRSKR
ncbi:MAG: MFS transporter [Desulfobacterales bacterium]|jgi:DHA1 family multidrug resistance protein-like MFS transporter